MGRSSLILLSTGMLSVLISAPVFSGEADRHIPFGVGWDNGLAIRYKPDSTWGMGLTLSGSITRSRDEDLRLFGDSVSYLRTEKSDGGNIGILLVVFSERQISGGMSAGPYFGLGFQHRSSHYPGVSWNANGWSVHAGIRPTFRFFRRLVLESRFGISLVGEHTTLRSRSSTGEYRRLAYDETRLTSSGSGLGPGSVLSFVVYVF